MTAYFRPSPPVGCVLASRSTLPGERTRWDCPAQLRRQTRGAGRTAPVLHAVWSALTRFLLPLITTLEVGEREEKNTRKAPAHSIIPLKVALSACETSQNAQKPSRS
jgi:hypothetical protein